MAKNYSNIAAASLAVAGGLFAVSLPFKNTLAGGMFHAASEAALVGGMADWYAVTALFRHPMNMKWIPHTAIIPKNRERIIAGIVDMVENKWLAKETIEEKLINLDLAAWVWPNLNKIEVQEYLASLAVSFLQEGLAFLGKEESSSQINEWLIKLLKGQKLSIWLEKICGWAKENGYDEKIFDFLYDEGKKYLGSKDFTEALVDIISQTVDDFINKSAGDMMAQMMAPMIKTLDFTMAAEKIQTSIVGAVGNNRNEYLDKFNGWLVQFADRLHNDKEFCDSLEEKKNAWLDKADLGGAVRKLSLELQESGVLEGEGLMKMIQGIIADKVAYYQNDEDTNQKINEWLKKQIISLIESKHEMIGRLVKENLDKLSEDDFVVQIEEKVGQDLQWIRVNGAVVGGLVGVILYILQMFL